VFRYTYNTLVYGEEPLEIGIARVAQDGYDGVEIVGEPSSMSAQDIGAALERNGVVASSIISIFTPDRDIVSSRSQVRRNAVDYVKSNIEFAHELGADIVTFTPTACMKISPESTIEREWEWASEAAAELSGFAGGAGLKLVLEPWNRYETYLITRADQAIRFIDEVGSPHLGYMADTFHMSIEEKDIAASIRAAGPRLSHVHLADSNRAAPGQGHLDFVPIMQAIIDTGYQGWISYELLPAAGDVGGVLSGAGAPEFKEPYTADAIRHTKAIVARLTGGVDG
jgi:sugar phosphate isomerase/epimerase